MISNLSKQAGNGSQPFPQQSHTKAHYLKDNSFLTVYDVTIDVVVLHMILSSIKSIHSAQVSSH